MAELIDPVSIPAQAVRPRRSFSTAPVSLIGLVLFGIGLLAVAVIMVLFATGSHDLPLWLNLAAMLAPLGFGLALLGMFLQARADRRAGR